MMATVSCTVCGSKRAPTRDRCPRCGTPAIRPDHGDEAAHSRRLARVAAGVLSLFVIGCTGIYMAQPPENTESGAVSLPDPLASRRQPLPVSDAGLVPDDPAPIAPRALFETVTADALSHGADDPGGTLEDLEAAVEAYPEDAETRSRLGLRLLNSGRALEAIPQLTRAAAINPGRWVHHFHLAQALGRLERWDESIASYRAAQQVVPGDYATTFNLARVLHKAGDLPAAIEAYRQAIALDPDEESFRIAHGRPGLDPRQHRADAAAGYEEYLRLVPAAPDMERVRARIARLTDR